MSEAAADFARSVAKADIRAPKVPVVLNATAQPSVDPDDLRAELATQITSAVRWDESIRSMARLGCTSLLELGPGEVLTGMTKRILPDARAVPVGSPEAIEHALATIASSTS